ncbi:MAG: class I SAM-dependent methyltransferase [Bacteroidetes bacterium]|nr:class I SAM-dependent methyltransferase [Bacteroidota bacterium]
MKLICFILFIGVIIPSCNIAQQKNNELTLTDTVYIYGEKTAGGTGKYYMGREIAHMIGPGGIGWLQRDDRPKDENTALAIEKMNLSASMVVADIGAGSGYYSFKIAKKAPKGKVYAVDVQDEMIAALKKQKAALKDRVVEIIKGDSLSPHLPDHSVDLALMVDVYHELEYPHEMLQAIKKALKPEGKLLLIEYKGEDPSIRIKPLHKMTIAQMNREMKANGFSLYSRDDFLPIQHFMLYEQR